MGKIKRGILGGFSGKVANVIGTSWKGIAVMKSMPLSVANPRTRDQVANRDRNTSVLKIAQRVGVSAIRTLWNRWAMQMSGFNNFVSVNKNCWSLWGAFVESSFWLSKGSYPKLILAGISASISSTTQKLTLDLSGCTNFGDYASNDRVFVAVINSSGLVYNVVSDSVLISDNPFEIDLVGVTSLNSYNVYISILKEDGTQVSDSVYTTVMANA